VRSEGTVIAQHPEGRASGLSGLFVVLWGALWRR
jgi:hypothetical protein